MNTKITKQQMFWLEIILKFLNKYQNTWTTYKTKTMERHDYELKQREDNMVSILAEDVFAKMFSVNILFEYKDKKYIAWGEFDEGLYLSDYWGVDTYSSKNTC